MSDPGSTTIRTEVRQWLAENWTPGMDRDRWRDLVLDGGWSRPLLGETMVGPPDSRTPIPRWQPNSTRSAPGTGHDR